MSSVSAGKSSQTFHTVISPDF
uniref:Uncharacterized protein n=1 Tax=Anguilla anguilla TaxID=7936 RepID=A0A0E9REP9_ANGAN